MQPNVDAKSKSLLGNTELTLVATVKDGLIPALDTRSHTSRSALVMKTLNTLRMSSREADPTPLIIDAVDRIRAIHSFRLSLLGTPPRQLMLSVTFDGGWETYMRQIWRDLGPLLDLIFCDCKDYLISQEHSYEDYIGWVRKVQVNTDFFYSAGAMTVNDLHYLRQRETERIDGRRRDRPTGTLESQALPAITALYRLTDMFPRWRAGEAALLERATRKLLGDAVFEAAAHFTGHTPTEVEALKWYRGIEKPTVRERPVGDVSTHKLQGGILDSYPDVTHGCLLLVQLDDAHAAQQLLAAITPWLVSAAQQRSGPPKGLWVNLAFTYPGLLIAGLPEGHAKALPQEFKEGMAARAGLLGDWRGNHPLHWCLPERLGRPAGQGDRVELSTVHVVLQVQGSYPGATAWGGNPMHDSTHPLAGHLTTLMDRPWPEGARVLAVQPMQRLNPHPELARGHFGYADGISQPQLTVQPPAKAGPNPRYNDQVEPGDLLLGFRNSLNDPPREGPLWSHSSFLVIRKLRQHVAAFQAAVGAAEAVPGTGAVDPRAALMGRHLDGRHLALPGDAGNDHDYGHRATIAQGHDLEDAFTPDPTRSVCPFQAHVRRANPRTPKDVRGDQPTVPRILRCGMSYGPAYSPSTANEERGLVFMAYNASIAEQFEVIQAWLAGGNSASRDSWSGQRDPFLGVTLDDEPLDVVFEDGNGNARRVHREPHRPWVTLDWGLYLFVPSLPAIEELQEHARIAAATAAAENNPKACADARQRLEDRQTARISALAARGEAVIRALRAKEQLDGPEAARIEWKLTLEDIGARSTGVSMAVWTAIRELHGGVLRTPFGVLVGSKQRVLDLFADKTQLTANGYLARMADSFGPIYLGLDDGGAYQVAAQATNAAIQGISRQSAYTSAFEHTRSAVHDLLDGRSGDVAVEVRDLVDKVLAALAQTYFGVPDGQWVQAGGWHGQPDGPPRCPGSFHAPSRHIFQPHPGDDVAFIARENGTRLRTALEKFIADKRSQAGALPAITQAVIHTFSNDATAASHLVGALMGFLPTVDGNLRGVLYEWMVDRSLWDHQSTLIRLAGNVAPSLACAESALRDPLARTMQLRPVPEITWRRAVKPHPLGDVDVQAGETVVAGIVSALHEDLLRDRRVPDDDPQAPRDLTAVFGGRRDGSPSAPTHACPGYDMAMGVMLGTLAGLMWSARLQPTLTPVSLRLAPRPAAMATADPAPAAPC